MSKVLPRQIADRYTEAMSDPDLLSLRGDVSLLDVRRMELAERLYTGESGQLWKMLKKAWGEFELGNRLVQEAAKVENHEAMAEAREMIKSALDKVKSYINSGSENERAWSELVEATQDVAAMKSAELSRLQTLRQMMSAEEVLTLATCLYQSVADEITDQQVLAKIGNRFARLLNMPEAPIPSASAMIPAPLAPLAEEPLTAQESSQSEAVQAVEVKESSP